MLEQAGLQNVVVEHKRKLAVDLSAALTDQVRALGLSDAKVWVSFDGLGVIEEVGQYPPGCTHAEADQMPQRKACKKKAPAKGKADRRMKHVWPEGFGKKSQRQPFYKTNFALKKKGLPPLTVEQYLAEKAKSSKN